MLGPYCTCCDDIITGGKCECVEHHHTADTTEDLVALGLILSLAGLDILEDLIPVYVPTGTPCKGCENVAPYPSDFPERGDVAVYYTRAKLTKGADNAKA